MTHYSFVNLSKAVTKRIMLAAKYRSINQSFSIYASLVYVHGLVYGLVYGSSSGWIFLDDRRNKWNKAAYQAFSCLFGSIRLVEMMMLHPIIEDPMKRFDWTL